MVVLVPTSSLALFFAIDCRQLTLCIPIKGTSSPCVYVHHPQEKNEGRVEDSPVRSVGRRNVLIIELINFSRSLAISLSRSISAVSHSAYSLTSAFFEGKTS